MRTLDESAMTDILYGCTILGTGGGGDLSKGLDLIQKGLAEEKKFMLIGFDELSDDEWTACPYMCGAVSVSDEFPILPEPSIVTAFKGLSEFIGVDFKASVPSEMGGMNTAVALFAAAELGVPVVDGDAAGRAVPELQHSTYYVNGIPMEPMGLATEYGDVVIIKRLMDDFRGEAIVRAMAAASGDTIAVVDHPGQWLDIKKGLVPNTLTYAEKLGNTWRSAKEKNIDVVSELSKIGNGKFLFKGTVSKHQWENKNAFTYGDLFIDGSAEYHGHTFHIWYKNENIVSWLDNKYYVTAPDIITVFDVKTSLPITNPNAYTGEEVEVLGLPAPKEWTTERSIDVFGPRYFGFDTDYLSVTDL